MSKNIRRRRNKRSASTILSAIAIVVACILVIAIGWQVIKLTVRNSPELIVYELVNNANIAYAAPEDVNMIKPFPVKLFGDCPVGAAMFGTDDGYGHKFGFGRIGVGRCVDGCYVFAEVMMAFMAADLALDIISTITFTIAWKKAIQETAGQTAEALAKKEARSIISEILEESIEKTTKEAIEASMKKVSKMGLKKASKKVVQEALEEGFEKLAKEEGGSIARKVIYDELTDAIADEIKDQAVSLVRKRIVEESLDSVSKKILYKYARTQWRIFSPGAGRRALAASYAVNLPQLVAPIYLMRDSAETYFFCCTPGAAAGTLASFAVSAIPIFGPALDLANYFGDFCECVKTVRFYYYLPSSAAPLTVNGTSGSALASGYENYIDAPQFLTYTKLYNESTDNNTIEISV